MELLAVELLQNLPYRRVILETDSVSAVRCMEALLINGERRSRVMTRISNILDNGWEIKLQHIFREGNARADWIAKWSCLQSNSLYVLDDPPDGFGVYLFRDILGMSCPRLVD
ncbi:uncharacterized protein LOC129314138 [Prosopis cineraria]|uniref:uncharacterized protein LOC129314138 n=1 Tax=Prosopis cineraria TaxID=364024 RepID=UPI00240F3FEA|nr:uncharacterized protein LOC129314138 [Prosopis cineraria]